MLRKLMVATAVASLMLGTAVAQSPPSGAPNSPAMKNQPASNGGGKVVGSQTPDQWLASKFKGTDVIGSNGEKIGDVSDVLFDKNGQIKAYVISVGGLLGMGAKEVALEPSSFQVVKEPQGGNDKLRLSMSKEAIQQAQNFERYTPPTPRATTGAGGGLGSRPGGSPAAPR